MGRTARGKHAAAERTLAKIISRRGGWAIAIAVPLAVWALWLASGSGGGAPSAPGTSAVSQAASPRDASPAPAEVSVGVLPGQRAPDFTVVTAGGERFRLSSHRGRVVVLDFLAPGCPSCLAEVRSLTEDWEAFRDRGLTVLVIDVGGGPIEEAVDYYRSVGGGDYLYAADKGFQVAKEYEVIALGTTLILDPGGIVTFRDEVPTLPDVLEREIGRALQ